MYSRELATLRLTLFSRNHETRQLLPVWLLLLVLLLLLEQPDAVVVRGYGRVVSGPDGCNDCRGSRTAIGRRPLPLVLLFLIVVLAVVLRLLVLITVLQRRLVMTVRR